MKLVKEHSLLVIALLVGVLMGAYLFSNNLAMGSVVTGSEYNANNITSADVGTSSVKTIAGTIGSIVVASTTETGTISIYATSTINTAGDPNDLVFSLPAGVPAGTYTYDIGVGLGILMDVSTGFDGNYVLTWR